jgi:cytochrome c oxidase cbb3-type subunit 2
MNYGPLIFLAAFFALASSWFGFVLTPQMQVGQLQPTNTVPSGPTYPVARPGLARQGLAVYRANGCAYCHSQQVGQTGTVCDVVLDDAGTNQSGVIAALLKIKAGWSETEAKQFLAALPKTVLQGVTPGEADAAAKTLKVGDAKRAVWIVPVGPDLARGWGKRRTVAEDFLYDETVMLGSQRIGPDLANVGARLPDANWHLRHLYAPGFITEGSTMPPYRFLFEKRRIERSPSPDALALPPGPAPGPGFEIVPKPEAKALVSYLTSLNADAPLFVAPLTAPAPAGTGAVTNAPATVTNSPPATGQAPTTVTPGTNPGPEVNPPAPLTNVPAK